MTDVTCYHLFFNGPGFFFTPNPNANANANANSDSDSDSKENENSDSFIEVLVPVSIDFSTSREKIIMEMQEIHSTMVAVYAQLAPGTFGTIHVKFPKYTSTIFVIRFKNQFCLIRHSAIIDPDNVQNIFQSNFKVISK